MTTATQHGTNVTAVTKLPKTAKLKSVRDNYIRIHMEVVRYFEKRNFKKETK